MVSRKQYKDNENQQISFYYDLNERGESVMTDVCILMSSLYAQFENQDDDDNITGNEDKLLIYEVNGDEDIVTDKYLNDHDDHDDDEDNDDNDDNDDNNDHNREKTRRYPSNIEFFERDDNEMGFDSLISFL